ncbi:MAG: hypothetical protein LC799_05840 [Actinobacteria bacterium]|nr:hypothetical protein [Actinomycetota bacterium]
MRGRNQAPRNVGLLRLAAVKAAQIRALPGSVQNREAVVVPRCRRGAVICRVFRTPDGLLALPLGRDWATQLRHDARGFRFVAPAWVEPEPYWLDENRPETLTGGCDCCPDPSMIETPRIFDAIRRGQKSFRAVG